MTAQGAHHAASHDDLRRKLAFSLHGEGIEFGPGTQPLAVGPLVRRVRYCDRVDRTTFLATYPQLSGSLGQVPETIDYVWDFEETDFAERLGRESVDFVIANHVLEHLVNPLLFLERVHAILRDGGSLYLAIPDKRAIFDRDRERTRLGELVDRYQRRMTQLSDAMIIGFINEVEKPSTPFGPDTPDYAERIARYHRHSIHANVWIIDDVIEILSYVATEMASPLELLDGAITDGEIIFVLRKTHDCQCVNRYAWALSRIWHESTQRRVEQAIESAVEGRLGEVRSLLLSAHDRLALLDERARETQTFVSRLKRALDKAGVGKVARWMTARRRAE